MDNYPTDSPLPTDLTRAIRRVLNDILRKTPAVNAEIALLNDLLDGLAAPQDVLTPPSPLHPLTPPPKHPQRPGRHPRQVLRSPHARRRGAPARIPGQLRRPLRRPPPVLRRLRPHHRRPHRPALRRHLPPPPPRRPRRQGLPRPRLLPLPATRRPAPGRQRPLRHHPPHRRRVPRRRRTGLGCPGRAPVGRQRSALHPGSRRARAIGLIFWHSPRSRVTLTTGDGSCRPRGYVHAAGTPARSRPELPSDAQTYEAGTAPVEYPSRKGKTRHI